MNAGLSHQAAQPHLDAAQHFADTNDNNYGALTSMGLARQFAEQRDLPTAEKQLQKSAWPDPRGQSAIAYQSAASACAAAAEKLGWRVDGALKILDGVKEQAWTALA